MRAEMQQAIALAVLVLAVLGCAPPTPSTELYAHPWPDERLRRADGTIDVSSFPYGTGAPLRAEAIEGLAGADGFGVSSAIVFPMDVALDPDSLPDVEGSTRPDASLALVNVDPRSPEHGRLMPLDVRQLADGGPFGGANLLVALPFPGVTLAPHTLYAAVVTTDVRTADGAPLPAAPDEAPTPAHRAARDGLGQLGFGPDRIAALAVLRTGDPTRELFDAFAVAERDGARLDRAPALVEEHEDYCVYGTTIAMPVYQAGEPPYESEGGGWVHDERGALVLQRRETSRVWITVPRQPSADPPTAVFVRAGGGGDRPLVDRGPRDASGRSAPGTGPATQIAQAGWVGISVDGPLGGARNFGGWDEQLVIFNVLNLPALRDTVRQSALELALVPHALEGVTLDTRDCAGAAPLTRLASDELALIAHSTGATIAPLAVAVQPRYRALVMSGAGASWIRQIVFKESPFPIRPFAEQLLGYGFQYSLHEHDPMLSLFAWAGEVADPLVYARELDPALHILVFQGVRDHYIPPPIANPVALSLGLDLAGAALDTSSEPGERPIASVLPLVFGRALALPVSANRGATRAVSQHPEDGLEDGHEVLFQQPAARRQLRCFLETLRSGTPVVVAPADGDAPCGP